MNDKGFQLPSPPAAAALQAATVLLAWCQDPTNRCDFTLFVQATNMSARKFQKRKEIMWGCFHTIRCSSDFVQFWKRFLALVSCEATPILFQNISDRLFRTMIKLAFPVEPISTTATPSCLTHKDLNSLRYAAGYVCRTVRKRIKRMKPEDIQLKLSLDELLEDDSSGRR